MVAAPGQSGIVTRCIAADAAATEALGARVAARCARGTRIHLDGELGAGKTTFARGFLHALGYADKVCSPTYTLVESYQTRVGPVFHVDLYRLKSAEELEVMGFRDYFDGSGICLVEWAERAKSLLGTPDLHVLLQPQGTGRALEFAAHTASGRAALPQTDLDNPSPRHTGVSRYPG